MRLTIFILFLLHNNNIMAQIEEQKYNVLKTFDNVQIREYDPVIYASVTVNERNNSLFRILAGYIFGGNNTNQKIAMTAPVHMHQNNNGAPYIVDFGWESSLTTAQNYIKFMGASGNITKGEFTVYGVVE